jgi:hypothetical protein
MMLERHPNWRRLLSFFPGHTEYQTPLQSAAQTWIQVQSVLRSIHTRLSVRMRRLFPVGTLACVLLYGKDSMSSKPGYEAECPVLLRSIQCLLEHSLDPATGNVRGEDELLRSFRVPEFGGQPLSDFTDITFLVLTNSTGLLPCIYTKMSSFIIFSRYSHPPRIIARAWSSGMALRQAIFKQS